ncbi:MAG: glycosyltransferase family 39 protein [Alphaproteobacteria bacterium]
MTEAAQNVPNHSPSPKLLRVGVLAALLAGAAVRQPFLDTYGPWFDEVYFSVFARPWQPDGVNGALDLLGWIYKNDVHPPFYFLLMLYWIKWFGQSAVVLRLPSLICGLAGIPAAYLLGRKVFGAWPGVLLAWLLALSPAHVFLSVEARHYPLLVLLAMFSFLFAGQAIWSHDRQQRWSLWGYLLTTWCLLGTHHLGWFLLAGQLVAAIALYRWPQWGLGSLRANDPDRVATSSARQDEPAFRRRVLIFVFVQQLTILLSLPWIFYLLEQSRERMRHLVTFSFTALSDFFLFLSPQVFLAAGGLRLAFGLLILGVMTCGLVIMGRRLAGGRAGKRDIIGAVFLVGSWVIPLLLLLAISLARPILYRKMPILFVVPFLSLLALGIVGLPRRWLRITAVLIIAAASVWSITRIPDKLLETPDYRAAHAFLSSPASAERPLVLANTWWHGTYLYYESGERVVFERDRPRLTRLLEKREPFFYLAHPEFPEYKQFLEKLAPLCEIEPAHEFNHLLLYRLRPRE